jgi:2'-5' RNA ligase
MLRAAMRLFYAAFLDASIVNAYESLVADLAADVPNSLRSVPAGSHHLTLAFLGEVAESDVAGCLDILAFARSIPAFRFSLGPPRILSSRGSPRLICVDLVEGREQVSMLQKDLNAKIAEVLPDCAARGQPPHVTLARFKKHAKRETARRVADALSRREADLRPASDRFGSVHLVRSTLTPAGPIYESLGEAKLPDR